MNHVPQSLADNSAGLPKLRPVVGFVLRLSAAVLLTTPLILFCGCPAGGGLTTARPGPTLTGCPEQDVLIGETVTLTISISEGTIFGVATTGIGVDTGAAVTRVDERTFSVVVTPPRVEGNVAVTFAVETELELIATELSCNFMVVTDQGACCEGLLCEVTDENECFFRDGSFHGPGTICDPNPCRGACCGLQPGGNTCEEIPRAICEADGGQYQGDGTSCDTGCLCETDADCPADADDCTNAVCEGGICGQRTVCAGGTPCDSNGGCPIQITVDFPTSLMNGESSDLTIHWTGGTHFRKTGQFFTKFGSCPDGFACASRTITFENADPFVIPNAFKCRIDGATEPVAFTYEAILTDWNGVGSNIVRVEFTCIP